MREMAAAAHNDADVAAIDAELAKVQPLDDYTPLREAYADRQQAMAHGAPPDVLAAIDAHIHDFTQRMQQADVRRQVEGMSAPERFLAGAGAGLTNVWQHAKELGHELASDVGPNPSYDPLRMPQRLEGPLGPDLAAQTAALVAQRQQTQQEAAPLTGTLSGELGNIAGEAAGTAPIAMAIPAGTGPVVGGTIAGAGTGALMSEPGQRLEGAGLGGAAGGLLGLVGKVANAGIQGIVKPTEAAKTLQKAGVEGMTAGLAAPTSTIAHWEQAAESGPTGATVKAARSVLPFSLESKFLEKAAPEGFTGDLSKSVSVSDRLQALRDAIGAGYDSILDTLPVPKNAIARDVARKALNQGEALLTPAERNSTWEWLKQQLGKLEGANSLETLHHIRSEVRNKAFGLRNTSPEIASHLGEVEDVLTGHINDALKANMDPGAAAKLAALDTKYHTLRMLEDAAAYEPAEGSATITPDRLLRELKGSTTKSAYARGAGGELRELASAGKKVLSPPRPVTGALTNLAQSVPLLRSWAPGVLAMASTRMPNVLLGQTLPQRVLQKTLGQPVVSGALGQAARVGAEDVINNWLNHPNPPEEETSAEPPAKVLTQSMKKKKKAP